MRSTVEVMAIPLVDCHSHGYSAAPAVRTRIDGRWHNGIAHPLPEDDASARLTNLPRMNSAVVRASGTDLLTIRIDLTD